jgi:hypothetical protein
MSELTIKSNENKIMIPKEFQGFTEEEVLGGMAPVQESYLKSFKYFLTRPSMKAKFQIVDNTNDEVVWEGNEIQGAIIYYGHEVLRLKKGHVFSEGKNEADFTEEENEILAVTYDAARSSGNFNANGFGQYLSPKFKELQSKMRRLFLFMILPKQYNTGSEVVAASFSITTIKSFNDLREKLKTYGPIPHPLVRVNIFFSDAKSKSGQEYDRVDFALTKGEDGGLKYSHSSREGYLKSEFGKSLLDKLILTHRAVVEYTENQTLPTVAITSNSGSKFEEYVEAVKDTFKGTEVEDDRIPF